MLLVDHRIDKDIQAYNSFRGFFKEQNGFRQKVMFYNSLV